MQRLIPKSRMGLFTAVLVCLLLIRKFLLPSGTSALDLLTPLLAIPGIYYLWQLFSVIRRKLLWKIRRRLILAHIFIGAIPVLLIVFIVYVTVLLFYYQLSYYLVANQIGIHMAHTHAYNIALRTTISEAAARGSLSPPEVRSILEKDSKYLFAAYPSASIIVHYQDPKTDRSVASGYGSVNPDQVASYQIPTWARNQEFSGLVLEDSQPGLYWPSNPVSNGDTRGRLFLRSIVHSDLRAEAPFSVEVSVPMDGYLLERLKAALGLDLLLARGVAVSGLNVVLQNTDILRQNVESATFDISQSGPSVGRPVWSILLFPVTWSSGKEWSPETDAGNSSEAEILFVELSTAKLVQNVFRSESGNVSRTILGVLQIVVGFFLVVEVISLIVGIVLTKSITSAVYNLDRGTGFIRRGDFSHRVVVKSDDQLGALAASFNQMTEYVQTLVKERVQKERLERELEIAKEVQEQLFPRSAPHVGRLELTGICLPARVVSGDYYDFLTFGPERLGLALGDICGKGISAALLMANLQATLRANVMNGSRNAFASAGAAQDHLDISSIVQLLNHQIYNYTSANKYASFFYAVYDDARSSLTYCNAGHNPPLYFHGETVTRLTTGGTVIGIFPDADFEQETIELSSGDLFFAYTDGILESVNEYGEEFGEERIIAILKANRERSVEELQRIIVQEVRAWAFEEERDDDMTLILAKVQ
jgi:sigma-B regulation protein RsbU (phosphoserine phosphatase)